MKFLYLPSYVFINLVETNVATSYAPTHKPYPSTVL